jgi:SHS2 domain-containing protein
MTQNTFLLALLTGGYKFLDHMTDAVIEASGTTLNEAFENAALALVDTTINLKSVETNTEIQIQATGRDLETLLFDWLDKVLLCILIDRYVARQFIVNIDRNDSGYLLRAIASGETLDVTKHGYKVEIKAITFHEMKVVEDTSGVTLKFVLDL